MLSDFWFSFSLEPASGEATPTLVRIETHYDPSGISGRLMSEFMAKRRFRQVRKAAHTNLKHLAEGMGASKPETRPAAGSFSEKG